MIQRLLSSLLAVCCAALAAHAQQAAPRAVVPQTAYEFGDIYKGETISNLFVIRNEGSADLIIKDFVGTCGCEVLNVDRVIAPGKAGWARVEISTASQPGGKFFKSALLHTNDPEHATINLTLMANVLTSGNGGPVKGVELRAGKHVGPVFVGPDLDDGVAVAPGQTATGEFLITVERGPLNVQRVESEGKVVRARVETVEPGRQYKVVFENLPTQSTTHESLRVITDSPALPVLPLTVHVKVQG
ncbi:MAG TPA: DUF1573 domain-containing protein [Blastocatellia bacterium]|nr:DUF1573 domain-containing protein [Blastocatellia bacterium]